MTIISCRSIADFLVLSGLSVVSFIAGLLPRWHHHLLLISTAFIGSTALTLGIDCFTRAGLKEFYCFNLGFRDLFPKVEGYKYPLLTIMQVELGVLAACFCVSMPLRFPDIELNSVSPDWNRDSVPGARQAPSQSTTSQGRRGS